MPREIAAGVTPGPRRLSRDAATSSAIGRKLGTIWNRVGGADPAAALAQPSPQLYNQVFSLGLRRCAFATASCDPARRRVWHHLPRRPLCCFRSAVQVPVNRSGCDGDWPCSMQLSLSEEVVQPRDMADDFGMGIPQSVGSGVTAQSDPAMSPASRDSGLAMLSRPSLLKAIA